MKEYIVHLYRAPDCIRGWLAYLQPDREDATVTVMVEAESGSSAKNKAITLANKGFIGLDVLQKNSGDGFWSTKKHPDIEEILNERPDNLSMRYERKRTSDEQTKCLPFK